MNRINDLIFNFFLLVVVRKNWSFYKPPPRQRAGGALGGGLLESLFSIRIAKGVKPLIALNRFGQLLSVNGQLWVLDGQKPVAILVEL